MMSVSTNEVNSPTDFSFEWQPGKFHDKELREKALMYALQGNVCGEKDYDVIGAAEAILKFLKGGAA